MGERETLPGHSRAAHAPQRVFQCPDAVVRRHFLFTGDIPQRLNQELSGRSHVWLR